MAFSKNGLPTITARDNPDRKFGQRCGFSVGDIMEINILFQCPEYNEKWEGVPRSTVLCERNRRTVECTDYCNKKSLG